MDRLWKYLMQLDAKALFFGSVVLFLVVMAIVAWLYLHRASAAATQEKTPAATNTMAGLDIGVLGLVSNQMSAEALVVPVSPFRPSIENLLTRPAATTNITFVALPKTNRPPRFARPPKTTGSVIPTLTFRGFFQRPDGSSVALFHDSVDDTSKFFTPGSDIRGASLVATDIKSAKVRKPDGQTVDLAIGDSFTLPALKP